MNSTRASILNLMSIYHAFKLQAYFQDVYGPSNLATCDSRVTTVVDLKICMYKGRLGVGAGAGIPGLGEGSVRKVHSAKVIQKSRELSNSRLFFPHLLVLYAIRWLLIPCVGRSCKRCSGALAI